MPTTTILANKLRTHLRQRYLLPLTEETFVSGGKKAYLVLTNRQKCCRFQPEERSSKGRITSGTPLERSAAKTTAGLLQV